MKSGGAGETLWVDVAVHGRHRRLDETLDQTGSYQEALSRRRQAAEPTPAFSSRHDVGLCGTRGVLREDQLMGLRAHDGVMDRPTQVDALWSASVRHPAGERER